MHDVIHIGYISQTPNQVINYLAILFFLL